MTLALFRTGTRAMAAKRRSPDTPAKPPAAKRAPAAQAPAKPSVSHRKGAAAAKPSTRAKKASTVKSDHPKAATPAPATSKHRAGSATAPKTAHKPSTAGKPSRREADDEARHRHPPEEAEASDAGDDEATDDADLVDGDEAESDEGREAPLPIDEDADSDAIPAERALAPARKDALAPTDLLQRYMAEVTRYPLLSREEETSVAREFVKTQDPALAERLVKANLRLVVKIAWEYRRAAFNLLDLVQEGNVGLMQGVKKFDPERGVKLSTYAAWWIRAYIIRYLMDNWRLVKLGTTQAQRKIFFNLRKEKDKLLRQGINPEPKLLAESLQVTEQEVVDMDRRLASDDASLDAPYGEEGGGTMGDRLEGTNPDIDTELAENEIKSLFVQHLDAFSKTLEPGGKERYLFDHRLRSDEPMTLQEVGDHFGISRERARQIEARLVQRLKDYMREHLPDFEQLSLNPPAE